MGYTTTPIDTETAKSLAVGGKVVSASKDKYFVGDDWKKLVGMAEIKDDNKTIFFGLAMGCFVEYELADAVCFASDCLDKHLDSLPAGDPQTCRICGKWYNSTSPDDLGCCSQKCVDVRNTNHHYNYHY
jgi:hypothetical protein